MMMMMVMMVVVLVAVVLMAVMERICVTGAGGLMGETLEGYGCCWACSSPQNLSALMDIRSMYSLHKVKITTVHWLPRPGTRGFAGIQEGNFSKWANWQMYVHNRLWWR